MDVLKDKAYLQVDYISRYSPFPYYYHSIDKKYILGTTAYLKDDTIYQSHKVTTRDTLDTLALQYYNNPTLYWVIASFNHIQDPFKPLKVGSLLKIPALSNIEFDI